ILITIELNLTRLLRQVQFSSHIYNKFYIVRNKTNITNKIKISNITNIINIQKIITITNIYNKINIISISTMIHMLNIFVILHISHDHLYLCSVIVELPIYIFTL